MKLSSTAVVQQFHCGGTKIPLRRYERTNAMKFFWYNTPSASPLSPAQKNSGRRRCNVRSTTLYIYQQIWSLVFLVATDHLPQAGSDAATHQRSHDEHPNLRQGIATLEKGRTERTGRIDTRARVVNTHQVNEDE